MVELQPFEQMAGTGLGLGGGSLSQVLQPHLVGGLPFIATSPPRKQTNPRGPSTVP